MLSCYLLLVLVGTSLAGGLGLDGAVDVHVQRESVAEVMAVRVGWKKAVGMFVCLLAPRQWPCACWVGNVGSSQEQKTGKYFHLVVT
jgi:hypothetical protein